ncbi:hypothetical protein A6770_19110 [Nostoc minutum NIES-26]|uniref:Uncharacterized protein n=1 Tax=Nostoc minutum NIES-26 TaxID=1844469 RepID=A0A367R781_9NOSO|nr:hypothetical protein A6770_19110 [Nostoc minutum NIES-26]
MNGTKKSYKPYTIRNTAFNVRERRNVMIQAMPSLSETLPRTATLKTNASGKMMYGCPQKFLKVEKAYSSVKYCV